jgi:DNA-binding response OmpR family regulator
MGDGPGALRGQKEAAARNRTQQEVTYALRRILLIDDTPEIAELLSFSLRDAGYEVFPSGYTVSVNELIREHQADALVLDCTSFDMSEALFDAVRHSSDHAEFPVAIISDTPELADASLRARKAQKVLLIPKPFTGSQVATALSQLLG